jgi:hypothetical protein
VVQALPRYYQVDPQPADVLVPARIEAPEVKGDTIRVAQPLPPGKPAAVAGPARYRITEVPSDNSTFSRAAAGFYAPVPAPPQDATGKRARWIAVPGGAGVPKTAVVVALKKSLPPRPPVEATDPDEIDCSPSP